MISLLMAWSVLALAPVDRPRAQVSSKNQSGGVTAGWIGTVNQYVSSSDLAPSLSTELIKSASRDGRYSLTLTVRNASTVPIELAFVRYSVGAEVRGLELSYGRKVVRGSSKLDLRLTDDVTLDRPTVMLDVAFVAKDKKKTAGAFQEKFEVPNDPAVVQINPTEHVDNKIDRPALFGSEEELRRVKGEYVFSLVDDLSAASSGGFQTENKFLWFNSMNQAVVLATNYDQKTICLAAPLFNRGKGLRRVRVYWDDGLKKAGLSVDGIEVTNSNSVRVQFRNGPKCTNTPPSVFEDLLRTWSN